MVDIQSVQVLRLHSEPIQNKRNLPGQAGIYFVLDSSDQIRYIGLAKNIRTRWLGHHRLNEFRQLEDPRIAYLLISDVSLLASTETALIEYFQPDMNATIGGQSGGRSRIYREEKFKKYLSLTKTAIEWLEQKQRELNATSLSDVIERMSREDLSNNG